MDPIPGQHHTEKAWVVDPSPGQPHTEKAWVVDPSPGHLSLRKLYTTSSQVTVLSRKVMGRGS